LDYKSPKELGEYLLYLDSNKTAYNSYFKWKKHVNFLDNTVSYGFICEMCVWLHMEQIYGVKPQKPIRNFRTYWQDRDCYPPNIELN
jgi:hypothetical protein